MSDDLIDDDVVEPTRGRRAWRLVREIVVTAAIALVVLSVAGWLRAPAVTGAPPPLRLTSLAGDTVDLAALRGQRVVVNFWATWCTPCRVELPLLRRHDGPDTPVLFVAVDGTRAALTAFARAEGLPLERVLLAEPGTQRAWGVGTLPTTFAIGPDGRVEAAHTGIVSPLQLWWWGRP